VALTDQMIRASRLDVNLYEEVERDTTQTTNALTVVVISAVASGIGAAISQAMASAPAGAPGAPAVAAGGGGIVLGLIAGVLAALVGWAIWTAIVYFIGTSLFGGTATWGEVLRTVGFANAPGVLRILVFIPILGGLINLLVSIWLIVTTVVAVRQALDITTGKAIIVSIIGGIVAFIVIAIIGAALAIPAIALGALG
jgi:hypothetical protein